MAKENKDVTLFDYEMSHIDGSTGEVTSKTATKVVKRDRTPDFIMLFTAGAPLLRDADLSKREQAILNHILGSWITTSNRVEISTTLRQNLSKKLNYSLSTVYKGLNSLKKKGIFVEKSNNDEDAIEGSIYLNPHIFGRGHWNDIKKLRYDIQVDFDFEQLEARTTSSRTVIYNEVEDLLEGNLKEVERVVVQDSDSVFESEIIVEEKEDDLSSNSDSLTAPIVEKEKNVSEEKISFQEKLKMVEAKNKEKELEIQLKKLSMEELKMKMEAKKIGFEI